MANIGNRIDIDGWIINWDNNILKSESEDVRSNWPRWRINNHYSRLAVTPDLEVGIFAADPY